MTPDSTRDAPFDSARGSDRDSARDQARALARRLRDAAYRAVFAGGCVRDTLLGIAPHDYDIATSARPPQVLALFPGAQLVGAQFGVVIVEGVEIATFRNDGTYRDGRHPDSVTYADDPATDAQRRDFTINGMFQDPESGEVLDFVGGRADLNAGILRAIGEPARRFAEDKLRLLRAVRFAARFRFTIEPQTLAAIQAARAGIAEVSRERIGDELTKMLTEGQARYAFELLDETGLLREVLPEIAAMKGVQQPPQFHSEGDVWTHTLIMLRGLHRATPTLAWGTLLHDVGKPPTFTAPRDEHDRIRFNNHAAVGARMAEAICERLRFSNRDTEQIVALVENHMRFGDVKQMRESTLKRFLRMEDFDEHMALHRLDCESSHRDLSIYQLLEQKRTSMAPAEVSPPPLLNGNDLIALGYHPGPSFSQMLRALEDAQLEGQLHTPAEAQEWLLARYPLG